MADSSLVETVRRSTFNDLKNSGDALHGGGLEAHMRFNCRVTGHDLTFRSAVPYQPPNHHPSPLAISFVFYIDGVRASPPTFLRLS